jgi:hypothetical protein
MIDIALVFIVPAKEKEKIDRSLQLQSCVSKFKANANKN